MKAVLDSVESSNVLAIGYDEETRSLVVRFHSSPGTCYVYADVPPAVAAAFKAPGASIGSLVAKTIRGKYEHKIIAYTTDLQKPRESIPFGEDAPMMIVKCPHCEREYTCEVGITIRAMKCTCGVAFGTFTGDTK